MPQILPNIRRVAVTLIGTSLFQVVHTEALYLLSPGVRSSDVVALGLLHYMTLH